MSKYSHLLSEDAIEAIKDCIFENALKPGDKLPTEREFSEQTGLNRETIRTALRHLRNEHRIVTIHGKGHYIAKAKYVDDTSAFLSFSEGWGKDRYRTASQVLSFEKSDAGLSIARRLNLSLGEPLYVLRRLRFLNEEPFTVETDYIPVSHCPDLDRFDFSKTSLWKTLNTVYHIGINSQKEQVTITRLSKEEAHLLDAKEGDPAFFTRETTFADEKPIEICITIHRADRYRLSSVLHG